MASVVFSDRSARSDTFVCKIGHQLITCEEIVEKDNMSVLICDRRQHFVDHILPQRSFPIALLSTINLKVFFLFCLPRLRPATLSCKVCLTLKKIIQRIWETVSGVAENPEWKNFLEHSKQEVFLRFLKKPGGLRSVFASFVHCLCFNRKLFTRGIFEWFSLWMWINITNFDFQDTSLMKYVH